MADQPTHHAILVGINAYPDRPLKGCVRDVQKIKTLLQHHTVPIDIKIFTATQTETGIEEDPAHWPTYNNVTAAFREVTAAAKAGDCVYIHFSGHGTRMEPASEFSNEATGDLALALLHGQDASKIRPLGGHRFAMALNAMVNKGLVITLVLDCCFAASIYRLERTNVRFMPHDSEIFVIDDDEPIEATEDAPSGYRDVSMQPSWLIDPNGYAILAACGPHEEATEIIQAGVEHGALSFFLSRSLRDFGMNKRHRDIFYRLSPSFKASALEQTPALYGNKNQEFFGPHTLATTRPVIPAFKSGQSLVLQAGQAHGLREGDDFILYPSGVVDHNDALHDNTVTARLKTLGPLTSLLQLMEGTPLKEINCVAEPQTKHCFHDFAISLSDKIAETDEWLAAFRRYSLAAHRASDNRSSLLSVEVAGKEYRIYKAGRELDNLPVLQRDTVSPEDIAALLEHVVRYEFAKTLTNNSPSPSFQSSFDINITTRSRARFVPNTTVKVTQDDSNKYMFELVLQNNSAKELYLYVFSLGPFWQVDNVFCGSAVIPPLDESQGFTGRFSKKMRTEVPKEMRAKGLSECEDTLKVIVTSHPTSFDVLELPKIGGLPKKPSTSGRYRSGGDGAEDWVAFNFPLRTSLLSGE
ncbi:caspase domain-containing protein [Fusarium flagelliforme]|uniref:Peptidase C14 caspase domain-containing protein n=1 Tax=Fusarium flagelliforme TaxID=2675880 RepID=A0A395N5B6_9HYPO|nr:caspase domain-containing protein [Fusarium flagelliforme]KAH7198298.1 caspase domain-containing protein [Fusarium flagelliforme]RFN55302.1 hypothetical protein FIE12Z_555 [Fusarium flagelliforme]